MTNIIDLDDNLLWKNFLFICFFFFLSRNIASLFLSIKCVLTTQSEAIRSVIRYTAAEYKNICAIDKNGKRSFLRAVCVFFFFVYFDLLHTMRLLLSSFVEVKLLQQLAYRRSTEWLQFVQLYLFKLFVRRMPEKIAIVIFRQITISFCILHTHCKCNALMPFVVHTFVISQEKTVYARLDRYPVVFVLY